MLIFMLDLNQNVQHNRHRNMDSAELSDRFEQHQRLKLHVQSMRTCSFRAVGVMRAMAKLSPALRAHQGAHQLSPTTPHYFMSTISAPSQALILSIFHLLFKNIKVFLLNNVSVVFSHITQSTDY